MHETNKFWKFGVQIMAKVIPSMLRAGAAAAIFTHAAIAQLALHEVPLRSPSSEVVKLLSGSGTTVIGFSDSGSPARWQLGAGMSEIGAMLPFGLSETGAYVCGAADGVAVKWSAGDGLQSIGPATGYEQSLANAVSTYGVAGQLMQSGFYQAASWRSISGWRLVTLPSDATWSVAVDISGNGVVAGNWQRNLRSMGAFWAYRGLTFFLPGPDGGRSWVWDTSSLGNVFVGVVPIPDEPYAFAIGIPHRACVWAYGNAPVVLPPLPNTQRTDARATSDWGRVVVGTSFGSSIGYRATVWSEAGPIDLTQYLECEGIASPTLSIAIAVSDDGSSILSRALGTDHLYLITGFTPPPGPITDLNWDGNTDGIDLGLLLSAWGPCSSPCDSDLDRDGAVDGNDLAQLLAKWGSCP